MVMMMDDASIFAVNLALKAGNKAREFFNPAGIHASSKPDRTVVTEADLALDKMIALAIHEQYPKDEIISEESSHSVQNNQGPTWIVDPLDGTTNFSLGLSIWGVSIARINQGYPELGALYFPMINELYTARQGSGAFLNNQPIHARAPNPAQPMSFFACCSRTLRYYDVSIPYKARILGSCTYSFCMVARGLALLGFDATPKIWDLAAIWVLVEEAGGNIAGFEGTSAFPVMMQDDYSSINYPTLASATPELFSMGQKKIQRKTKFGLTVKNKAKPGD
jgi:myo-inositol-1(or 4)-monophosphatase